MVAFLARRLQLEAIAEAPVVAIAGLVATLARRRLVVPDVPLVLVVGLGLRIGRLVVVLARRPIPNDGHVRPGACVRAAQHTREYPAARPRPRLALRRFVAACDPPFLQARVLVGDWGCCNLFLFLVSYTDSRTLSS